MIQRKYRWGYWPPTSAGAINQVREDLSAAFRDLAAAFTPRRGQGSKSREDEGLRSCVNTTIGRAQIAGLLSGNAPIDSKLTFDSLIERAAQFPDPWQGLTLADLFQAATSFPPKDVAIRAEAMAAFCQAVSQAAVPHIVSPVNAWHFQNTRIYSLS